MQLGVGVPMGAVGTKAVTKLPARRRPSMMSYLELNDDWPELMAA